MSSLKSYFSCADLSLHQPAMAEEWSGVASAMLLKGRFGSWKERYFVLAERGDGALELQVFESERAKAAGRQPQSSRAIQSYRDVAEREGRTPLRLDIHLVGGTTVALAAGSAGGSSVSGGRSEEQAVALKASWVEQLRAKIGGAGGGPDGSGGSDDDDDDDELGGSGDGGSSGCESSSGDDENLSAEEQREVLRDELIEQEEYTEEELGAMDALIDSAFEDFCGGDAVGGGGAPTADDGDGVLNIRELRAVLTKLAPDGYEMGDEALEALVAEVDADGDGALDEHEFACLVLGQQALLENLRGRLAQEDKASPEGAFYTRAHFDEEEAYVAYLMRNLKVGMQVRCVGGAREGDEGWFKEADGSDCPLFFWAKIHEGTWYTDLGRIEVIGNGLPLLGEAASAAAAAANEEQGIFVAHMEDDHDVVATLKVAEPPATLRVVAHGSEIDAFDISAELGLDGVVDRVVFGEAASGQPVIAVHLKGGLTVECNPTADEDGGEARVTLMRAPRCNTGMHTMVPSSFLGVMNRRDGEASYESGWNCDLCSDNNVSERWFCPACCSDVCYTCHPKPEGLSEAELGGNVMADGKTCPWLALGGEDDEDEHVSPMEDHTYDEDVAVCDGCEDDITACHGCPTAEGCEFALCGACQGDAGKRWAAKLNWHSGQHECPNRCGMYQGLRHFVTPCPGYGCDSCGDTQAGGVAMFGCSDCNFDLCASCFMDDELRDACVAANNDDADGGSDEEETSDDDSYASDDDSEEEEEEAEEEPDREATKEQKEKYELIREKWKDDDGRPTKDRPTVGDLVYVTDGPWRSVKGKLDDAVAAKLAKLGLDLTEEERVGLCVVTDDDKDGQPYRLSCQAGFYYYERQVIGFSSIARAKKGVAVNDDTEGFVLAVQDVTKKTGYNPATIEVQPYAKTKDEGKLAAQRHCVQIKITQTDEDVASGKAQPEICLRGLFNWTRQGFNDGEMPYFELDIEAAEFFEPTGPNQPKRRTSLPKNARASSPAAADGDGDGDPPLRSGMQWASAAAAKAGAACCSLRPARPALADADGVEMQDNPMAGQRFEMGVAQEAALAAGAAVELHSLKGKAELNGTAGTVVAGPDAATGRFQVRCDHDGETRAFKPENLTVSRAPAAEEDERKEPEGPAAQVAQGKGRKTSVAAAIKDKDKDVDPAEELQQTIGIGIARTDRDKGLKEHLAALGLGRPPTNRATEEKRPAIDSSFADTGKWRGSTERQNRALPRHVVLSNDPNTQMKLLTERSQKVAAEMNAAIDAVNAELTLGAGEKAFASDAYKTHGLFKEGGAAFYGSGDRAVNKAYSDDANGYRPKGESECSGKKEKRVVVVDNKENGKKIQAKDFVSKKGNKDGKELVAAKKALAKLSARKVGVDFKDSFGYYSNGLVMSRENKAARGQSASFFKKRRKVDREGEEEGADVFETARFVHEPAPAAGAAVEPGNLTARGQLTFSTVGCGLNVANREVFFTHEHEYVGTASFRACGPRELREGETLDRASFCPVVTLMHVKSAVLTLRWRKEFTKVEPHEVEKAKKENGEALATTKAGVERKELEKKQAAALAALNRPQKVFMHTPFLGLPMPDGNFGVEPLIGANCPVALKAGCSANRGELNGPSLGIPDLPFQSEHKNMMDYLQLRHDVCDEDDAAKDIHKIIAEYVKCQVELHNKHYELGERVRLCARSKDDCAVKDFPDEGAPVTLCRVPPPGGHGTFVSDALGQSFVVRFDGLAVDRHTGKKMAGKYNEGLNAKSSVYFQLRSHDEIAGRVKANPQVPQRISRRFVRVLTQAVRFSHNPISAALASSYACKVTAAEGCVSKNQTRQLAAQSEKFCSMAYQLVDNIEPGMENGTLFPTSHRELTGLPQQRLDETAVELALTLQDKSFLHHPACEDFVDSMWKGDVKSLFDLSMPDTDDAKDLGRMQKVVRDNIAILSDIDSILSPVVRFFTAFGFTVIFVALQHLVVFSRPGEVSWGSAYDTYDDFTVIERVFVFFSFGFLVSELEELTTAIRAKRIGKYLADGWNIVDWAIHLVFAAYFAVRWRGILRCNAAEAPLDADAAAAAAAAALDALRVLSFNCVFLWMRLMNVMTVSERLGPMIRMITLMAYDVAIFLVLLFMYIIGFAGTFNVWFGHVVDDGAADMEDLRQSVIETINSGLPNSTAFEATPQADLEKAGFDNLYHSMLTLFSASMGDFSFDAIRKEQPVLGPVLMMLYLFVGAVMLLNLLIAILSDVYARVQESALAEFSFAKAKTVATYSIFWHGQKTVIPLPPPLNLVTLCLEPLVAVLGGLGDAWSTVQRCFEKKAPERTHESFAGVNVAVGVGGRQRRRRGVSVSSLFRSLANAGILIALLSAVTGAAVWAMTVVSFLLMVPLALLTRVLPRAIANAWAYAKDLSGFSTATKAARKRVRLVGAGDAAPGVPQRALAEAALKLKLLLAVIVFFPLAALFMAGATLYQVGVFVRATLYLGIRTPMLMFTAGLGSFSEVCDEKHLNFPALCSMLQKFKARMDGASEGKEKKQAWRKTAAHFKTEDDTWARNTSAEATKWWAALTGWSRMCVQQQKASKSKWTCTDPRFKHALLVTPDLKEQIKKYFAENEVPQAVDKKKAAVAKVSSGGAIDGGCS